MRKKTFFPFNFFWSTPNSIRRSWTPTLIQYTQTKIVVCLLEIGKKPLPKGVVYPFNPNTYKYRERYYTKRHVSWQVKKCYTFSELGNERQGRTRIKKGAREIVIKIWPRSMSWCQGRRLYTYKGYRQMDLEIYYTSRGPYFEVEVWNKFEITTTKNKPSTRQNSRIVRWFWNLNGDE